MQVIDKIINHIFQNIIENKHKTTGLVNGVCSELIFLEQIVRFNKDYLKKIPTKKITDYIDKIYSDFEDNNLDFTYAEGIPGILCSQKFLSNSKYFSLDFIEINDFNETLIDIAIDYFEEDNYDFLYGAIGVMMPIIFDKVKYGISDYPNNLSNLIQTIFSKREKLFWRSKDDKHENIYDFGVAHGFISILYLLSVICKNRSDIEIIKKTVFDFLSFGNFSNSLSIFPDKIDIEKPYSCNSRLGWCYGDLGIGNIIYQIGNNIFDEKLKQIGIQITLKSSNRINLKEGSVLDASICHGTSGIALMYQKNYQISKNKKAYEAYHYWKNKTLEFYDESNKDCCFGYVRGTGTINNFGLLQGIAGIGIFLMNNNKNSWSNILLIG
ncbi:lanthionine synthetase LanC family protein [Chryseobacterium sp. G0201]|uniref:lanthionine synthetase LanC family protein n=1 Tax=Chryseobacterium sp. G0201 TaxID=2487065 RepID=UPI000F4E69EA|nr:lanthionine synthetase LanC family protein [Chryseobacterium sp. G0201]AZA55196.1 hypothetical protein EG348_20435 [Chryseobacterium sp. G0201]